jgi:ubiquinone/menaquinone biosynthesis C-methylase UbiE
MENIMFDFTPLTFVAVATVATLSFVALFFYVTTQGALVWRRFTGNSGPASHIYPIYSEMWLIKMVDFQPLIAAILLFQYSKLVDRVITALQSLPLSGKEVLITSCAFGNVIPRVVHASIAGGAGVRIADLVCNELTHAAEKLAHMKGKIIYVEENATAMTEPDAGVAANVIFFLLHELPLKGKARALAEAERVLAPGGKLIIAEFHRPTAPLLRFLSRLYFKVFEPYGLDLWDSFDLERHFAELPGWSVSKETLFFGNFQVVVATKTPR